MQAFVTDGLPVFIEQMQAFEMAGFDVRHQWRHFGKRIHEQIDRRHDRRMVEKLTQERQSYASAKVNKQNGKQINTDDKPLHACVLMVHTGRAQSAMIL